MNKVELIEQVATINGTTKAEAGRIVESTFATISGVLGKGGEVSFAGFGTFAIKETAPRKGRNPKTGESIDIPAGKKVTFKPNKGLKDLL